MTEQEILENFSHRNLNLKINNYIFCGTNDLSILDKIPSVCSISSTESDIDIDYAINVKIDLEEVNVKDVLSYTLQALKDLSLLDVTFDYNLEFNNKFDLIKFQNVLYNYGKVVQIIFSNVEELDIKEQMLFNEIYHFNSIYFNANSFIKNNNFQSYSLNNGQVLDDREDYTKVNVNKRIVLENNIMKNKVLEKKKIQQNNT